jgi:hypothetical protein
MDIIQEMVQWVYPILFFVLIILTAIQPRLRARFFLIAFFSGSLIINLMYRIPNLMYKLDVIEIDTLSSLYRWAGIPLSLIHILILCLFIPYVFLARVPKTMNQQPPANIPR